MVAVSHGGKDTRGKSRVDLLCPEVLLAVGDVLAFGAAKYAEDSWKNVKNARSEYYGAAMRHMLKWRSGETLDDESGLHHLAHAICDLMFVLSLDMATEAKREEKSQGKSRRSKGTHRSGVRKKRGQNAADRGKKRAGRGARSQRRAA